MSVGKCIILYEKYFTNWLCDGLVFVILFMLQAETAQTTKVAVPVALVGVLLDNVANNTKLYKYSH